MIHSNANLGVHGQGLLNLSGPGDWIEAQRLVLSLFYSIHVSSYSVLSTGHLSSFCLFEGLVYTHTYTSPYCLIKVVGSELLLMPFGDCKNLALNSNVLKRSMQK